MNLQKNIGLLYFLSPFISSHSIIENKINLIISILLGKKTIKLKIKNLPDVFFKIDDFTLMQSFIGSLTFATNYSLVNEKFIELSFDFKHKFTIPISNFSEEDRNLVETLFLCVRAGADFLTENSENPGDFRSKTLKIYEKEGKKIIETFSGIKFYLDSIHPGNTIVECFINDIHSIRYSDDWTEKIVIDVGAECGDTPLYYASKGAKVFAFEPVPDNYNSMLKNFSLNPSLSKNIVPINAAVGKNGTLKFFQSPDSPTYGSSFVYNRYGDKAKTIDVKGYELKKILDEFEIKKVDLLKMDCKGCEIYLNQEILKHVNSVKIEYMSQFSSNKFEDLKQLLEDSGFICTVYRNSPFARLPNKLNGHIYAKKTEH